MSVEPDVHFHMKRVKIYILIASHLTMLASTSQEENLAPGRLQGVVFYFLSQLDRKGGCEAYA